MRTKAVIQEKRSHACGDVRSREVKARRIAKVLTSRVGPLDSRDVLDIGTGAGLIAAYLTTLARSLVSVDVVDERIVRGFEFRLVSSELLPVEAASFDVVVSNHVIEHVADQLAHLQEIRRVLRPAGVCYLATPNRLAIMEPHFNLPFLSWLPEASRSSYVRLARKGPEYDVQPLTFRSLAKLVDGAALCLEDCSSDLVKDVVSSRFGISNVPDTSFLRTLYPSFVVMLTRRP